MEDIDSGLKALVEEIRNRGIRSIAIPPLGSGLGGLNWAEVRPRIEAALRGINDLHVIVFEPNSAPVATKSREVPNMSPGRAALVVLINRYLGGLMDPFVTLLEIHKLMYFMQEAGEPLRLKYAKAPYGPYAENLRHVLHAVEGHLVSGYADGGDAPDKQIELVPGAVQDAEAFLNGQARHGQPVRSGGQAGRGVRDAVRARIAGDRPLGRHARERDGCGRRGGESLCLERAQEALLAASDRHRLRHPSRERVAGGGMKTDTSEKGLEALIASDELGLVHCVLRGGALDGGCHSGSNGRACASNGLWQLLPLCRRAPRVGKPAACSGCP